MKFTGLWAIFLVLMSIPAMASPPNVICAGGNAGTEVRFIFPLITENNSVNESLIIPFYTRDIIVMFGPIGEQQKVVFQSEDIIGLWLDDGRIDIRFYREEENEDGKTAAFDLVVRTKITDERSVEGAGFLHRGSFLFRAFDGPLREGRGTIIWKTEGEAVCN